MNMNHILATAALTLLATPSAFAQEAKPKSSGHPVAAEQAAAQADAPIVLKQRASYPLTTCVACGKALPATPVEHVHAGRLFRLDSEACAKAVDADAKGMTKKIDEAVVAQQKPTYPLKVSAVSEKPLEASAVDHVYGTRLVRLASAEEVATFEKDPGTAMAKVDKALIEAQLPGYAVKTCPVSHEELKDGEAVNYLYGTKLVRFCCKKCVATFEKEPEKYSKPTGA